MPSLNKLTGNIIPAFHIFKGKITLLSKKNKNPLKVCFFRGKSGRMRYVYVT